MGELFMTVMGWDSGRWTNEPERTSVDGAGLRVTARKGTDAWRTTSYGFVRSSEHALLAPFEQDTAVEVSFVLDFSEQFDQAGIFVRADEATWIKAGVEHSDGTNCVGAVVTRNVSDWSLARVPDWDGREVTIRASRSGDALTVRARADEEPWQLVRVAPLNPQAVLSAGPYCCAPSREGFTVQFTSWRVTAADAGLHPEH